jgi:hypothetical protein
MEESLMRNAQAGANLDQTTIYSILVHASYAPQSFSISLSLNVSEDSSG